MKTKEKLREENYKVYEEFKKGHPDLLKSFKEIGSWVVIGNRDEIMKIIEEVRELEDVILITYREINKTMVIVNGLKEAVELWCKLPTNTGAIFYGIGSENIQIAALCGH